MYFDQCKRNIRIFIYCILKVFKVSVNHTNAKFHRAFDWLRLVVFFCLNFSFILVLLFLAFILMYRVSQKNCTAH